MNSTQKNFILIELLLVVAIIVVLISILFPAQGKAREKIASGFYGLSPHLHGEQKSPQMVRNASRVVSPSIAPTIPENRSERSSCWPEDISDLCDMAFLHSREMNQGRFDCHVSGRTSYQHCQAHSSFGYMKKGYKSCFTARNRS